MLHGRDEDRPARRADADLERDRVVRRLHPADGPRHRAARHDEPGDARRRSGSASASRCCASRARSAAKHVDATLRSESRRGVGREPSSGSRSRWRIDPDGSLGIRKYFESPYRPGQPITMDEYYGWIFENSVPGPAGGGARSEDLTPLAVHAQVRRVQGEGRRLQAYERRRRGADGATDRDEHRAGRRADRRVVDGVRAPASTRRRAGSSSTRRRSPTGAGPSTRCRATCPGHVHWRDLDRDEGEFDLLPNFRLPTLDPHALAGEVAVRDLAQQPAVDRDRRMRRRSGSTRAIWSKCARASATSSRAPG